MLKIALTGNLGSGKSTAGKFFREAGLYVFDADLIIRKFYEERGDVYTRVVEAFGDKVLDEKGNIDRKKLANLVFEDKDKLSLLEDITHKALYKKLEEEFQRLPQKSVVVVEASLLIEKGTYRNYHATVLVYAPYELCKERSTKSGYSIEDFERRWKRQMPPEEKLRYANFIVENKKDIESLKRRVFELSRVFLNWLEFQDEGIF
ncbi:MAG: dephospho-CoA kinase [Aquificaceae bacterium]|nr:dephospho-CoA kinase [Aquificaceae bacterium]MDW8422940.1 dephospho-CoA kinase [Aquificaceae bacterium]